MPKSGEHEDQTAPIEVAASMPMTVSGRLGRKAATRSPGCTRSLSSACAKRDTAAFSSRQLRRFSTLSSPRNTIAVLSSFLRSRFSAKFSCASGNHCAPGMEPAPVSVRSPRSPITSAQSHSVRQKASGSRIDQSYSAG